MAILIPLNKKIKRKLKNKKRNLLLSLGNIKTSIQVKKERFSYDDIFRIEFESASTPDFYFENMCIERDKIDDIEFQKIIDCLRENKILKWKRYYLANFEYYDGGTWVITITFKNNKTFITAGDIIYPKHFDNVYSIFEQYIIESDNEEINQTIIDKWFK